MFLDFLNGFKRKYTFPISQDFPKLLIITLFKYKGFFLVLWYCNCSLIFLIASKDNIWDFPVFRYHFSKIIIFCIRFHFSILIVFGKNLYYIHFCTECRCRFCRRCRWWMTKNKWCIGFKAFRRCCSNAFLKNDRDYLSKTMFCCYITYLTLNERIHILHW